MALRAGERLGPHEIVAPLGAGGFSLHPDGTRFATSIQIWPSDIWMVEGFDR